MQITQVKIVNNTTAVIITGTQRARTMSIASGSTFEKQLEMSQLEIGVPRVIAYTRRTTIPVIQMKLVLALNN